MAGKVVGLDMGDIEIVVERYDRSEVNARLNDCNRADVEWKNVDEQREVVDVDKESTVVGLADWGNSSDVVVVVLARTLQVVEAVVTEIGVSVKAETGVAIVRLVAVSDVVQLMDCVPRSLFHLDRIQSHPEWG